VTNQRVLRDLPRDDEAAVLRLLGGPDAVRTEFWSVKDGPDHGVLCVEVLASDSATNTLIKGVFKYTFEGLCWENAPSGPLPPQSFGSDCDDVAKCDGHFGYCDVNVTGRTRGLRVNADIGPYTQLAHRVSMQIVVPVWEQLLRPDAKERNVLAALHTFYLQSLVEWVVTRGTHVSDDPEKTVVRFTDRSGRPLVGVISGAVNPEYKGSAPWVPQYLTVYHAADGQPDHPDLSRQLYLPVPLDNTNKWQAGLREKLMTGVDGLRRGCKRLHWN
jgi:hypothetical protein